MCRDCVSDAMAFHFYAKSTGGDIDRAVEMVEDTAAEPDHLTVLAAFGTYLCASVIKGSSPTSGKILVARRSVDGTPYAAYGEQLACFQGALQHALDLAEEDLDLAGDACTELIGQFVNGHERREGVKLVAAIVLNYLEISQAYTTALTEHGADSLLAMIEAMLREPDSTPGE